MLKITKQEAGERWDSLPIILRETLFDQNNIDNLWHLGQINKLPESQISEPATVAGDVLMGFLRPNASEVAKEIQDRLGLSETNALAIAGELERKIFLPVKSELQKIYAPPGDNRPSSLDALRLKNDINAESENSELEIPVLGNNESATIQSPITKQSEQSTASDESLKPFILHQEKPLFEPEEMPTERPSVSFQPTQPIRKPAAKPTIARIEMPESGLEAKADDNVRVVHYSDLRTPLDKKS